MAQKITVRNARITFKNLSGRRTDYNPAGGKRDFAVVLDNYEDIQTLVDIGFDIKYFKKKNEEDLDVPYLKVKVNFRYDDDGNLIAPHVYIVNGKSKTLLTPVTIGEVDRADIKFCDLVIKPYFYNNVAGRSGVSAYLDKMYVNINEDELEQKYEMYDDDDEEEEIPFE